MFGFLLSRRVKAVEEGLAKLRRDLDDRDLDWVDMRSRCKRLLDRTEKAAKLRANDTTDEPAANVGNGNAAPGGRFLTPHQLEVQQQVLKRRAGGG